MYCPQLVLARNSMFTLVTIMSGSLSNNGDTGTAKLCVKYRLKHGFECHTGYNGTVASLRLGSNLKPQCHMAIWHC